MPARNFNNQTFSFQTNNHQVLPYYEMGTDGGRPVIKVYYDDGSSLLIDLTNGGLTSDSAGFIATSSPSDATSDLTIPNITADGTYPFTVNGGADGTFTLVGDFGGGTATLQYIIAGIATTYDNSSLSANGGYSLRWATDDNAIVLAGSTNPSLTALACF